MSFSNKVIRCHILDRRDQVEEAIDSLEYLNKKTASMEEAVRTAQKALDDHKLRITKVEKLKTDIEATLDIHWLDNPPY